MTKGITSRIGALIDNELESLRARIRKLEGVTNNLPPVADDITAQTVTVDQTLLLDASGSTDPEGEALAYSWSLDGTEIGTDVTLAYRPTEVGDTTVRLTVTDPEGATDFVDVVVTAIAAEASGDPQITSPAAGAVLPEGAIDVAWSAGSTTGLRFDYDVYDYEPSTTEYVSGNIYPATGIGEALSHEIPPGRVPGDGRALWQRLVWSRADKTFYTTSANETLTDGRFHTVQVVAPTIEGYGDSNWPSMDTASARGGWMYGSMHGPGHNTDNGTIGNHIVPFVAEATGRLTGFQYHNRYHDDPNRAWSSGNYGWGNSGGRYRVDVIELSIDANGVLTQGQSLNDTMTFVPFARDRNGYPIYDFGSPAEVIAGQLYGVRMINEKEPPNGGHSSSHGSTNTNGYASDIGAIALNGQIMQAVVPGHEALHMGPIQGQWGWRGFTDRGNGYAPNLNVMYFAVIDEAAGAYGHLTTAYNRDNNYDAPPNIRKFSSGQKLRQLIDYSSPTRAYQGIWLHLGHDRSQSTVSGSIAVQVKSGNNVIASGSLSPSQATLDRGRSVGKATGSWLYCAFSSPVTLQKDDQYTIEITPESGCHLEVSTFYPISLPRVVLSDAGIKRRDDVSGRAQYLSGGSWREWGEGYANNRDIGHLLVIDGAPTNINDLQS